MPDTVKVIKSTFVSGVKAKDVLDFIQHVMSYLAWPLAAMIIILILREPIRRILNRLAKLKYGDAEVAFSDELREAKASAESANISYDATESVNLSVNRTLLEEVEQVATISPMAAIPLAWSQVESEIYNLISRLGISPDYPPHNSALKNMELLRGRDYIDKETFDTLRSLRRLRNEVIHAQESGVRVTVREAIEYGKLAEAVSKKLREIIR